MPAPGKSVHSARQERYRAAADMVLGWPSAGLACDPSFLDRALQSARSRRCFRAVSAATDDGGLWTHGKEKRIQIWHHGEHICVCGLGMLDRLAA
ncbi:hypothetical protein HYQ46_006571 [Verticillium longisporum]|nr:hypothetical protein HYQ46_006571 [Verticillium longisporum]